MYYLSSSDVKSGRNLNAIFSLVYSLFKYLSTFSLTITVIVEDNLTFLVFSTIHVSYTKNSV